MEVGVGAENCHNCHNCHTFGVKMGSVVDDGFLLPAVFGMRKHRETFYIT